MNVSTTQPPVLLIIFNRPNKVRALIESLKAIQPGRVFISADGPRENRPGEAAACAAARQVAQEIPWPCEIKINFSDHNLGCKMGVSSAISWFFQHVDEGIILEDDCLPNHSFFPFCQNLLEKYRNNEKIMMISGDSFIPDTQQIQTSYYFSKYAHIWGWATWKRAWTKYDGTMASYPQFKAAKTINHIFPDRKSRSYWTRLFDRVYDGQIDTWDAQWQYAILSHDGLCVAPRSNMVSNIGFGSDATHTRATSRFADLPTHQVGSLIHPTEITQDKKLDQLEANYTIPNLAQKMISKIKSFCYDYL